MQKNYESADESVWVGLSEPKLWVSDFFQDWWAEMAHGAKNGGSFSEILGPSISKLSTVDISVVYFTYTPTQTLVCTCTLTSDDTIKPVLSGH